MGDEKVKSEAMQIIGMFQILPKLVVFDLDYTLWPFYCECRSKREMPSLYPHAKGILYALKDKGIDLAIASRSPTPDIASTFLDKLSISSMFPTQEIFSSWTHKTEHFQKIHSRTGVSFNSMLFFDDEDRNINTVSKMGVTSILVGNGVNLGALREGLTRFSQNTNTVEKNKQRWTKFSEKANSSKKKKKQDDDDDDD
ncbi:Magnesium-dependent phosphatase 1 [Linum grandiflorum]